MEPRGLLWWGFAFVSPWLPVTPKWIMATLWFLDPVKQLLIHTEKPRILCVLWNIIRWEMGFTLRVKIWIKILKRFGAVQQVYPVQLKQKDAKNQLIKKNSRTFEETHGHAFKRLLSEARDLKELKLKRQGKRLNVYKWPLKKVLSWTGVFSSS